jgi:hypothetical protein
VAAPAPPSNPTIESESEDDDTVTDFGMVMALSAISLVGVAFLATLFPFGRFISAVLAAVGLVGGISSLGAEGRAKAIGGLAIGLHSLILFFVVLFPSWVGLDSWNGFEIENAPPAPQAFVHGKKTTTLAQWVDAATASWQFRDVRVTICSATVGPIDMIDPKGVKKKSKDQYLQLVVRVMNFGVERPLDLSGWTVGQNLELIQLTDSAGRSLAPATFEEGWNLDSLPDKPPEKLYPSKSYDVRLIFSAPQSRIDFIRASFAGAIFGFEEVIKFQIESGFLVLTGPKKK